jgi:5-methylcytosine-specific restriction endonuclease McrBC regulatory subunit McrC
MSPNNEKQITVDVDDLSKDRWLTRTIKGSIAKVKEINKKYSQPRLKMTPLVQASLLILRLYLIMLVIILVYKFITVVK